MRIDQLAWSPRGVYDRAEVMFGLIILYRRHASTGYYENNNEYFTKPGNYEIVGMHPDKWMDLDILSAQSILFHLLEKYEDHATATRAPVLDQAKPACRSRGDGYLAGAVRSQDTGDLRHEGAGREISEVDL